MSKKQPTDPPQPRRINPALKYSGMAAQMAGFAAIGFFGGRWIDGKLGFEKPVFAIGLLIFLLGVFMYKLVKDVSQDK